MARKRTSKRGSANSRSKIRAFALISVLGVAVGIAAVKWAESPAGQIVLSHLGVAQAEAWSRTDLELRILAALESVGVASTDVSVAPAEDGPATVTVRTGVPLLELNVAVTEAVVEGGGAVHKGERTQIDGGPRLEMHLGTARRLTHRLLAYETTASAEPLAAAPPAPPLPKGRLAIVIDDWGYHLNSVAREMLDMDFPLTLAVLPNLEYSRRVITEANRVGKRCLLHMPMEPEAAVVLAADQPAIWVGMEPDEIRALLERCLDDLPGVEGLNNHMGSEATRSRATMAAVMPVLADRGLLFLDSLTSPKSVAYRVAREFDLPALRNDGFLDDDTDDPDLVERRLWALVDLARTRGNAVAIGHIKPATAEALRRVVPQLEPTDVELVFARDLAFELPQ